MNERTKEWLNESINKRGTEPMNEHGICDEVSLSI